jgi:hypothetical protein
MDSDGRAADTDFADALPPIAWESTRLTGLVGLGLTAAAAALALVVTGLGDSAPGVLNTARLLLVTVGSITAGAAVSMRPELAKTWAIGAATAAVGIAGLPAHWDSFRLLFGVLTAIAVTWAVVLNVSPPRRLVVGSALLVFHFCGIMLATTTPPSTPWLTEQLFVRVFNPSLQFFYLRNAYHFYSPEPGPASLVVCLLKTETGTDPETRAPQYKTEWVVMPRRPADVKDPLGLTYYRRLSLTEQVARTSPGLLIQTDRFEKTDVLMRRQGKLGTIPYHVTEDVNLQYRLPHPDVVRYVIPSYAQHIIWEHMPDAETAKKMRVKMYRLEHRTLPVEQFVKGADPYSPVQYFPYFLGEYDAFGKLVDPQEELLYWQLPVNPRFRGIGASPREYDDYLSVHALELSSRDELDLPANAARVFNWSQLR